MSGASGEGDSAEIRVSVVIPSWRDAESLAVLVPGLAQIKRIAQIVIVDASADAATEELAIQHGAILLKCSAPNRGAQMNVGAMFASGDVVIFHHADTELGEDHIAAVQRALRDPEIVGGAFHRKFDDRHPRLVWLEKAGRYLSERGGTLYGDQSIFVRRERFVQIQGFAKIPLMEDVEFSKRLRAAGKIAVLDPPVRTSARRHQRKGAWKTTIQNGLFIVLYKCGVSPTTLHRWYYSSRAKSSTLAGSTNEKHEAMSS